MILLAILLAASVSAPSVKVKHGDTLESIATATLGDPDAASELASLNHLPPDAAPPAGARLVLPGPARAKALAAIRRTQDDMRLANSEEGRKAAQATLDRAYDALRAARYRDAHALAAQADGELAGPVTRVSVEVAQGKGTRFTVQDGDLEVRAAGAHVVAAAGETVAAAPGAAPVRTNAAGPEAPALAAPDDGAVVATKTPLRWDAAEGASRYRVVVATDREFHHRVYSAEVAGTVAAPSIGGEGTFFWHVLAISADGAEGIPSEPRSFTTRAPAKPAIDVGVPIFGQ